MINANDNTGPARRMALENQALCTHRFKEESPPNFAWCEDCRSQLLRMANKRRTGKTERKRARTRA